MPAGFRSFRSGEGRVIFCQSDFFAGALDGRMLVRGRRRPSVGIRRANAANFSRMNEIS